MTVAIGETTVPTAAAGEPPAPLQIRLLRLLRPRPAGVTFVAAAALYLAVGVWLALGEDFVMGDALSRVANAQSVLFSRDPHLSAIGFVFTPLTTLVQLPLTALTPLWPALTEQGMSAVIVSALFMAGSVVQIRGIGADRGLPPVFVIAATLCYALNPMIIFYGANGMSEALFLFFGAVTVRRLLRWTDTDDVHDLVVAGLALGCGYLTRYDVVAATAAAAVLVAVVTWRRGERDGRRLSRALLDGLLVAAPAALAFVVWAVTSWLITGDALAQFTSEYGNKAIIAASGGTGSGSPLEALGFSIIEMFFLAPAMLLLLAGAAISRSARGRLTAWWVPVAVFGGVQAFQIISYVNGSTFGFLRFYISAIPLAVIAAFLVVPARIPMPTRRPGRNAVAGRAVVSRSVGGRLEPEPDRRPTVRLRVTATIATVLLAGGLPLTFWAMGIGAYAPQEAALRAVLVPEETGDDAEDLRESRRAFTTERAIAEYLDALDLPDGSVLVDTVYGFAVVARSENPRQFVVPSDADFVYILNRPAAEGVRYLLTVPPEGRGAGDALNLRYPTLYETGGDVGRLVLEIPNQGVDLPEWRLYEVIGSR